MLPPIPPETLSSNPQFANLYSHLTSAVLDPKDLTTRATSKSHDILDQELRTHRAELAKEQLLRQELETITTTSTTLPDDLRETLDIVTRPPTSPTSLRLIAPKSDDFQDSLAIVGFEISTSLCASALAIAKIAYPAETNVRALTHKIDLLPADTALLRESLPKSRESLAARQADVAKLSIRCLKTYDSVVRFLTAHPLTTLQKGTEAKSVHLAIVAESMAGKLKVLRFGALEAIYDPDALDALENYKMHLTDTNSRLVARRRVVEEELKRYEKAGSDMRGLVEKYSAIVRSIDSVGKDIKRLGGVV